MKTHKRLLPLLAVLVLAAALLSVPVLAADEIEVSYYDVELDLEEAVADMMSELDTDADSETAEALEAALNALLSSVVAETDIKGTVVAGISGLNVRTGASLDDSIIDVLLSGEVVEILGEDGNWYQVTYDGTTAYVYQDYINAFETVAGLSVNLDEDAVNALSELLTAAAAEADSGTEENTETVAEETADTDISDESDDTGLTPEGNLSLVDDYEYTDDSDSASDTESGMQFVTLVTKNGNYFYLIIDRDDDGTETVHFLNLVDEYDLLSLIDDEELEEIESILRTDDSDTEETEVEEVEEASEEAEVTIVEETAEEESSGSGAAVLLLLFLVGVGGVGAFLYFKLRGSGKASSQERPDPDEDETDEDDAYDLPVESGYEDSSEDDYDDELTEYSD